MIFHVYNLTLRRQFCGIIYLVYIYYFVYFFLSVIKIALKFLVVGLGEEILKWLLFKLSAKCVCCNFFV